MTDQALRPSETALVLIDLQARIVAARASPRPGAEVVRAAARLARAFRDRGGLVVVVTTERRGLDPQPPGSEIVPQIGPDPADLLVTKHTWGAFHRTGLHDRLRERGITTLALAGIATNYGVESTARAADEHEYRLLFAEDAMTGLEPGAHEFAVSTIFPRLGEVCSADDLIARLERSAGRPPSNIGDPDR